MSYTKAVLEEKLHDTRDQLKEQEKKNEQLEAENSALKEDNLRLREENARLSALVDELNSCNEGLRGRLKVIEVEMEAAELEARSAALADEADALVESLPIAPVEPAVKEVEDGRVAAILEYIFANEEEEEAEDADVEAEADVELEPVPLPELKIDPEPEPEKAKVEELPVSTDIGAEKIIEITPNEVVFNAEESAEVEKEENRTSIYHPYGEKKPPRVSRPSGSRQRRGVMGRFSLDSLTEGELDDD